jgi:hypothetical protein
MRNAMAVNPMIATQIPVAQMVDVEVKRWHGAPESRVFGWQRMSVKEALRLQDETFRCPECLGRVRLRQASPEKELVEHAEHFSKNPGCSLGNCFSGEKSLHPKPLN